MAKLVLRDLVKRYGAVEAVRGVSFEIGEGEIFGLLGRNGAGKTSVIECAIGLRGVDSGSVEICGINAQSAPERVKEKIGVVLQSTALQDKITPREAMRLFGSFYSKHADVEELMRRFALAGKGDVPFDSLSAGERQRLALGLAFVNEPEVLFLDEPTAGLDAHSRSDLYERILEAREEGCAVLLTTHYTFEVESLCDRVAIMDRGVIVAVGTPKELIEKSSLLPRVVVKTARPVEVARFLGLAGVEGAEVQGSSANLKTAAVSRTVVELVHMLESLDNELVELHTEQPTLEAVFIGLTGGDPDDRT